MTTTNGQVASVRLNPAGGGGGGGGDNNVHFDNSALIARDASNVNEQTNMIAEVKDAEGVAHPLPVRPAKGASHGVTFTRLRSFDDGGPGNTCGGNEFSFQIV